MSVLDNSLPRHAAQSADLLIKYAQKPAETFPEAIHCATTINVPASKG